MPASVNVLYSAVKRKYVPDMQLRYNFRLYPTPGQQQTLARAFGCARVVFNDALRARQEAFDAGLPYLTDAELSARLTAAKATPERSWLAEVSAVVLQQALADLHKAYRNFFASAAGQRKGPKVAPPRFRSRKDRRQSIRFTRNASGRRGSQYSGEQIPTAQVICRLRDLEMPVGEVKAVLEAPDAAARNAAIPAAELAVITHQGSLGDADLSYATLGSYATRHEISIDGPLREYYLRGAGDTPDEAEWRTEIGWPIFRADGRAWAVSAQTTRARTTSA